MGGFMGQIREDGSNGTADISWEGGSPKSTTFRSSVGERLRDTPVKFARIVIPATSSAADVSDKRFCSGPMIH